MSDFQVEAERLESLVHRSRALYPDVAALEVQGTSISYAALVANARRIAGLIRAARVGTPARIGLIGSRAGSSYAAYLAILDLGATVVPISSVAPPERALIIADAAGLDLVLADSPAYPVLRAASERGIPVLTLPGIDPLADDADGTNTDMAKERQSVAYILFTSGSTGRPKGVPISHRNVLSFLRRNIDRYGFGPGCRFSQTFDLSFDVSVYDIFVAWGCGATLVIPAADDLMHPVRWVNKSQITHWASVPSVISAARRLGELAPGSMPSLRLSRFFGEQLTREHAEAWHRAAPWGCVENFYGPTELAVSISSFRLPADIDQWPVTPNRTIPIGPVYEHLDTRLLGDERSSGTGELCVRGPQRFAGYLDPRDNIGRFVSFAADAPVRFDGSRPLAETDWYCTGDLVSRGPDGALTHLGRMDTQVKVRGFRVELSEIEGALRLHDCVDEAVVIATPGPVGSLELTGFYAGIPSHPRVFRELLGRTLPAYMIPRRFVHVPSFPLTISGKIDRLKLAENIRSDLETRGADGESRS